MMTLRRFSIFICAFSAWALCHAAERNLALDAMTSIVGGDIQQTHLPQYAVDGRVDKGEALWFGPCPCRLQIDLGEVRKVGRIHVWPYWDADGRYYQYRIEASADARNWRLVADASAKTAPETEKGSVYEFDPVAARFIRITFTYNSAVKTNPFNTSAHLVELQVFGPAGEAKSEGAIVPLKTP